MIPFCISGFGFAQLTVAMTLVPLQPYGYKYFWVKYADAHISSNVD